MAKWEYEIDEGTGEIKKAVFRTTIKVLTRIKDGFYGKTESGDNVYLQIIGEFGDVDDRKRMPNLLSKKVRIKITTRKD